MRSTRPTWRAPSASPCALLATQTHDTKRSGDVRARIGALSWIPGEWSAAVERWWGLNAPAREGGAPTPDEEYLVYQTLVGAWPLEAERLREYIVKALREAGRPRPGSSRTRPARRPSWPSATRSSGSDAFVADLEAFVARLAPLGEAAALGQTLLKLDRARRARHLPGRRAVGPRPGRPGQPPPGRLGPAPPAAGRAGLRGAAPARDGQAVPDRSGPSACGRAGPRPSRAPTARSTPARRRSPTPAARASWRPRRCAPRGRPRRCACPPISPGDGPTSSPADASSCATGLRLTG